VSRGGCGGGEAAAPVASAGASLSDNFISSRGSGIGFPLASPPSLIVALPPDADPLPFKSRIDLDHPGNLLRIRQCEISHHQSAKGLAHQHEWRLLAEFGQSVVQFKIDLSEGARLRAAIAPGISGTVVSANPSKLGNAVLHQNPVKGISEAILQYDNRTALARTVHVQLVAAKVNQLAGSLRARSRAGRWRLYRF
jgi:hypothetical protein